MKIKNLEMDNYVLNLTAIKQKGYRFPIRVAYAIERNIRILKEACQEYTEKKEEIIRRFGTKNEDGTISLTTENKDGLEALKEMVAEIGTIEHEVDIFQLGLEDFGNAAVDMSDMDILMFMIKED